MISFKRYLKEVLTEPQRNYVSRDLITGANPKRNFFTDHIFGGPDIHTITVPFKMETEVPESIKKHLDAAGYEIHDYDAGLAVAKGSSKPRPIRIGKVLENTKHLETHHDAHKDFINRTTNNESDSHELLITRDPHKIAEMSTNKSWVSCMALGNCGDSWDKSLGDQPPHFFHTGSNNQYIANDIHEGSHVAYLIRKGDTELKNPLMRVTLKPYTHEGNENHKILLPDAVHSDSRQSKSSQDHFHEKVSEFFEKHLNEKQPEGKYAMNRNLYIDNLPRNHLKISTEDLKKLQLDPSQSADISPSSQAKKVFDEIQFNRGNITKYNQLLRLKNLHPHFLGEIAKHPELQYTFHRDAAPHISNAYKMIINHKNFDQSVMNKLINHGIGEGYDLPYSHNWTNHINFSYKPEAVLDLMHHPKVKSGKLNITNHTNRLQEILFGSHPNHSSLRENGLSDENAKQISNSIYDMTRSFKDPKENHPYAEKFKKSLQMIIDKKIESHIPSILKWNRNIDLSSRDSDQSEYSSQQGTIESSKLIDHISNFGMLSNEKHINAILDHLHSSILQNNNNNKHDKFILNHIWINHRKKLPATSLNRLNSILQSTV
jgi:hypothetical protein